MLFPFLRKLRAQKERKTIVIALYDSFRCPPRIVEIANRCISSTIEKAANCAYSYAVEKGGCLPFIVIKEVVENLIHADFNGALISVYPDGNTLVVSDHGQGIKDIEKAFQPGFSTAAKNFRKFIRGVGSGLPIVRESLLSMGGSISIESNLQSGTVVTLKIEKDKSQNAEEEVRQFSAGNHETCGEYMKQTPVTPDNLPSKHENTVLKPPQLTERQIKVLLLIAEQKEVGPSFAGQKLGLSLTTAFRDLSTLEELGLVKTIDGGKRTLTELGTRLIPEYIS